MSVAKETLIFCDGGEALECPMDGCYSDGDTRHNNAAHIRAGYKGDGWRFIKGKDYCPDCVKRLRRIDSGKATP